MPVIDGKALVLAFSALGAGIAMIVRRNRYWSGHCCRKGIRSSGPAA